MIAQIDGDLVDIVGHYWISKTGYAVHKTDKLVHRTIAEYALGRSLKDKECVHHIDYNRLNNLRSNLIVCPNQKFHKLLHARQDCLNDGYNPNTHKYCTYHKKYEPHKSFSSVPKAWDGLHNMCREATNESRRFSGINKNKFHWKAKMDQQFRRAVKRELCSVLKEGSGQ